MAGCGHTSNNVICEQILEVIKKISISRETAGVVVWSEQMSIKRRKQVNRRSLGYLATVILAG